MSPIRLQWQNHSNPMKRLIIEKLHQKNRKRCTTNKIARKLFMAAIKVETQNKRMPPRSWMPPSSCAISSPKCWASIPTNIPNQAVKDHTDALPRQTLCPQASGPKDFCLQIVANHILIHLNRAISRLRTKLSSNSPTSYARWCVTLGQDCLK